MLPSWALFLESAAYVGLLFGIAWWGDRRAERRDRPPRKPWVYSLALGVYCTSWTFYGAVGRAAESGWDFLPIYLGPMLMFLFGHRLIARVVELSKRHNITSIADFLGARYGRHQSLAMAVTLVAVVGVLPYIALQIKAVAFSFEVLAGAGRADNTALLISALLAMFAILFGTRHVVSTENHHGMMLAVAFESVCKLLAFVALGLFAAYGLFDGLGDAYRSALRLPQVTQTLPRGDWQLGFVVQTMLAAAAVLCLPRQFHVTVVENTTPRDLSTARWMFPLYLGLISLFVLPIMAAGVTFLPAGVPADTYVLALPASQGQLPLTLAAYLGGFSAATSMVIVATVALSTMVCNEVVMPLLFRWPRLALAQRQDLSGLVKNIRRLVIVALVTLAYLYYRRFTGPGTLSSIGLLSFSAVLHFMPPLIGGLYWRRAHRRGALAGLLAGVGCWAYTLLLPSTLPSAAWVVDGPFGIGWLRPGALLGLERLDLLTHGVLLSLALHVATYVLVSLYSAPGLRERLQVARFLDGDSDAHEPPPLPRNTATVGDLQTLLERFFGGERGRALMADYAARNGKILRAGDRAEAALARHVEHQLAGALGAASARLVLASTLRGRDMQLEDVIRLLDDTSHAIEFNRELLRAALEHLSQGVSVVDGELRLVAWNRRYVELFEYPPAMVSIGRPIEELIRYNAERGLLHGGEAGEAVQRRLEHMRMGSAYTHQRRLPDGSVIEISGRPMPGGGYVTSYSDVSSYKRSEQVLEERVHQRTQELTTLNLQLEEARAAAERADQSKTRFLASASHDLVQPLNAARLFLASAERATLPPQTAQLLTRAENALSAAESLLSGLLDISRLDAQAQHVRREHFAIADLLEPLSAEFAALAREHGIELRLHRSSAIVETDPQLLRRILQNFLSNAVRYTASGRVVLGCRRLPGALRIEVCDTGSGVAPAQQQEIFQEFRRLQPQDTRGERGLGLGLAIADRVARLLGHPLSLRSVPGRGSAFCVTVPLGRRESLRAAERSAPRNAGPLQGAAVLCLDNEPAVLDGLAALLRSWDCTPLCATDAASAASVCRQLGREPDLVLIDYHLDGGVDGVRVAESLQQQWPKRAPGIVLTADHTQQARQSAQASGYALLPKPVKPAALRALMSRLLLAED